MMKFGRTLEQRAILFGAAALLIASLFAAASALAQTKSVAVTAIVEHPALNSVRDGLQQALEEAGFKVGENLRWEFQSAQGNPGTAASIARKFIGDKPDVIVAIATPSAQAVIAASKTIPTVYAAVTDPVAAQLVKDWSASGTNVTGVSDALVLEKQLDLILQVAPTAKRIGMVYNPGEANSVVVVERMKELLAAKDMTLVEATAPRTVDIATAARNLVGKVDAIYTNTDNNVVSAYEALVKVVNSAKLPLIASETDGVERGAIAALGVDYKDLGHQTGRIVVRILNGEKAGDIPSETGTNLQMHVNLKAAKAQGVTLSDEFIQSAAKVIE